MGDDWDLFEKDSNGVLAKMGEVVDGQYQKYAVEVLITFVIIFGADPELAEMASGLSDDQIKRMRRGGHDPIKVYAAYHHA